MSEPEQQGQAINVAFPPGDIFEFKKNIVDPATQVMEQTNSMFVLAGMKYQNGTKVITAGTVPQEKTGDGIFAYFQGVPYPAKGHPFPQALYAINATKKMFINFTRLISNKKALFSLIGFLLLPWEKKIALLENTLDVANDTSKMMLTPYYLEDGYYAPLCKQIMLFIKTFLVALGINEQTAYRFAKTIGSFIQYDNAYYFRFGDIMMESSKEAFLKNPRKELKRLLPIINERERVNNPLQHGKNRMLTNALTLTLIHPRVLKAFRVAMNAVDFEAWKLDAADQHHILLWADYKFGGKTIEERVKEYNAFYQDKLPPRITYSYNG